jgi:AraC-like DNA-binding protein
LIWYYESYNPGHPRERLLPMGSMELVMTMEDIPGSAPMLCGVHSRFMEIDTSRPETLLGVHFKPGGTVPFLKCAADEVQDSVVALADVQGSGAARLHERAREAKTPYDRIRLVEQYLLKGAVRPLKRHPAVAVALGAFGETPSPASIAEITQRSGLCHRRFIELFRQEVGLTPKLYCRVQRFQQVIRFLSTRDEVDWSELALDCGYYDQAHFINDFKEFSGISPTAYLQKRTQHMNHVPLDD